MLPYCLSNGWSILYCDVYATIGATLRIFEYQYTILFLCVVCMHRSITASCSMVVCIVVRHNIYPQSPYLYKQPRYIDYIRKN